MPFVQFHECEDHTAEKGPGADRTPVQSWSESCCATEMRIHAVLFARGSGRKNGEFRAKDRQQDVKAEYGAGGVIGQAVMCRMDSRNLYIK